MNNKPILDLLVIDTHNLYTLGVADVSAYPVGYQAINPSLQIFPPSFEEKTIPFTARNALFLNSTILEITCSDEQLVELPDGIWKLKYTITPADEYAVTKIFLRTEQLQLKFAKAFLQADNYKDERGKTLIDETWALINGAIAEGSRCNEIGAMDKYKMASSILSTYLKNQKNVV